MYVYEQNLLFMMHYLGFEVTQQISSIDDWFFHSARIFINLPWDNTAVDYILINVRVFNSALHICLLLEDLNTYALDLTDLVTLVATNF